MTLALRDPTVPDSPPARWDARWKLAAILVAAAGVAALRHPAPAAVALAAALLLARFARLPARRVGSRVGLLALATVPFVVLLPFTLDPAGPGWDIGPLRASEKGALTAAAVALRCLAIGTLALVLVGTAPLPATFAAARALKVPGVLILVAQLAYRYAFVLAGEARRLRTALRTRGFRMRTTAHTYRTLGHVAGALLVSGGERAETVAAAMRCRGFDGTPRALTAFRTTPADVLGFLLAAAGTIGLTLWDRP